MQDCAIKENGHDAQQTSCYKLLAIEACCATPVGAIKTFTRQEIKNSSPSNSNVGSGPIAFRATESASNLEYNPVRERSNTSGAK